MKQVLILTLLLITGCKGIDSPKSPTDPTTPVDTSNQLKVGAFNIQVFGVSKMSKPEVVSTLVKTVSRYDLVLIQEIRDAGGTVITDFMSALNQSADNQYDYVISSRTGRSSSKEQYAYIYKKHLLAVTDSFEFDDGVEPSSDLFEREPFIVLFEHLSTREQFFTIGIHVKPSDVVNELNKLDDVYFFAEDYYNLNKSIIMGDLNADCSYLSDSAENSLHLKTDAQFTWHINKSMDTTAGNSDCAYDRIITTGSISNHVTGVEIFNFQSKFGLSSSAAAEVSDHYPVSITLQF